MTDGVTIRPALNLPPKDTIAYFGAKGLYPVSRRWDDVWQEEHVRSFTVAKMLDRTLLEKVRGSLDAMLANGGTFEQWKAGILPELKAAGWYGRVENEELTGTAAPVMIGESRLRTIYDTNLRMARAGGQWKRIQTLKAGAPFLCYTAVLDSRTRPQHRAWHGTILHVDDPWWDTHFPPCGWFCRCTVIQLSQRDLDRRGWKVGHNGGPPLDDEKPTLWRRPDGTVAEVPHGIDPGFGYNPGKVHLLGLAEPPATGAIERPYIVTPAVRPKSPGTPAPSAPPADTPRPPVPAPRPVTPEMLVPEGTDPQTAIREFLNSFPVDATDGLTVLSHDVQGEPLVLNESFFYRGGRDGGPLKFDDGRIRLSKLLADALLDPQEIWWDWEDVSDGQGGRVSRVARRYLASYALNGKTTWAIVSMIVDPSGWRGVTTFATSKPNYVRNAVRRGVLAYRQ